MSKLGKIRHIKLEVDSKLYATLRNRSASARMRLPEYILFCVEGMSVETPQTLLKAAREAYKRGDTDEANRLQLKINEIVAKR